MPRSLNNLKLPLALVLFLATLALYSPTLRHSFVDYDDDRYVTENPHIQNGLTPAAIKWSFTTFEQANWHPLTWLSHALDCQLFHLNPAGHHATSILLHACNVVLLFLVLQWFTGCAWRSFLVASLFAFHPLNVESVAWVAERKSVLSMFFFLLTLAAYGWYVRKPKVIRYLLVAVLFAAGLMSKPMIITLPFLLLLLDIWPLGRLHLTSQQASAAPPGVVAQFPAKPASLSALCLEKIPLLLLSAASAVMTMFVQKAGGAVVSVTAASPLLRLANALLSYALYLKKMVWPSPLAVLYPYPHAIPVWQVAVAAAVLLAITMAVLSQRSSKYLLVGWLWFLGSMVPMIGLVQVGNQAMADRYAYLPLIGIFIMLVWFVFDFANHRQLPVVYPGLAAVLVLVALSWVAHIQFSYWQNDFTLWNHTLSVTRNNFVAENNLGLALMRQGQRDQALARFRAASAIEPNDAVSQFNLGVYSQEQDDLKQAIARYNAVLRLTHDAQLRSSGYANLGTIYFAARDYPQARVNLEAAFKLNRDIPVVVRDLGLIAQKNAAPTEAVTYFAFLVTIEPSDVNYFLLAQAFHSSGRDGDASWAYQKAVRLSKDINQTRQAAVQLQPL